MVTVQGLGTGEDYPQDLVLATRERNTPLEPRHTVHQPSTALAGSRVNGTAQLSRDASRYGMDLLVRREVERLRRRPPSEECANRIGSVLTAPTKDQYSLVCLMPGCGSG